jgi:hypothetical protein
VIKNQKYEFLRVLNLLYPEYPETKNNHIEKGAKYIIATPSPTNKDARHRRKYWQSV